MYDADDIFNAWAKEVEDLPPGEKYPADASEELIDKLCSLIYNNDIDYDEAKMLDRKVAMMLTTEEGRKGKGRHKNWFDNIKNRYQRTISSYYISDEKQAVRREIESRYRMPDDENIIQWVKEKHGNDPNIIEQAHIVGSIYWQKFIYDVYQTKEQQSNLG